MEAKKNPKVNLENYRGTFMLVGLILALIIVYFAFGISKENVKISSYYDNNGISEDIELIPITKPKPPKKTTPPIQNTSTVIEIVTNNTQITDEFPFPDDRENVEFVDFSDFNPNFVDETNPLPIADQMPIFPGGEKALNIFLKKNVKYPELAIENDIQGTVYVKFVVDKKGKVKNAKVSKDIDPLLAQEALRVVNKLPDFKPGIQNGRRVAVWMSIPVIFVLQK